MTKRILMLMVFAVSFLVGCHGYGGGVIIGGHGHRHAEPMPPAHAPAYGRRRQAHHYYYYPDAEFYFDIGRNVYFYLDLSGNWSMSARLPRHLLRYRDNYVELEMESDRPYTRHRDHKKKYKKGKRYKKHKKEHDREHGKHRKGGRYDD